MALTTSTGPKYSRSRNRANSTRGWGAVPVSILSILANDHRFAQTSQIAGSGHTYIIPMAKSKFNASRMLFLLQQLKRNISVQETCANEGIAQATFYNWSVLRTFSGRD